MKQKLYYLKAVICGTFGISMVLVAIGFHVFIGLALP